MTQNIVSPHIDDNTAWLLDNIPGTVLNLLVVENTETDMYDLKAILTNGQMANTSIGFEHNADFLLALPDLTAYLVSKDKYFKKPEDIMLLWPTAANEVSAYRVADLARGAGMEVHAFCAAGADSDDFLADAVRNVDCFDRLIAPAGGSESQLYHNFQLLYPCCAVSGPELASLAKG